MADEVEPQEKPPEDIDKLKAENLELKKKLDKSDKRKKRGPMWRNFVVWLLIILACIFALTGCLAVWARTTALDTDSFVNKVAPLISNPEVAKAVSDQAVQKLFEKAKIEEKLTQGFKKINDSIEKLVGVQLPFSLADVAGPAADGLQSLSQKASERILESSTFQKAWRKMLTRAHTAAMNVILENQGTALTSKGDTVYLDLTPLLEKIKNELYSVFKVGFIKKIPIPKDAGEIELFNAEALGVVKGGVKLLNLLYWLLPLLSIICFCGAVLVAQDRRRALLIAGIGLAITMLIVLIALKFGHSYLFDQIKKAEVLAAADVIWIAMLGGLKSAVWGLFALGFVVAAGAAFAGPYKWAVWVREHVNRLFELAREKKEKGHDEKGPISAFFDRFAWWFRIGGLLIAVIVLIALPHVTAVAILVTVAILAVYMATIELLR